MCDFAADAQAAEKGRSDTAIKKKEAKCAKPYRSRECFIELDPKGHSRLPI
jgi:hypothetical protein